MPQQNLQISGIHGFRGVNLHKDALDLSEGEMYSALNADFHTTTGVLTRRRGVTLVYDTDSTSIVSRIAIIGGRVYTITANGVLWRNGVSIGTGMTGVFTMAPFTPLNDTATWAFVANGTLLVKDDGTNLRLWGIAAPTAAATLAAGAAGSLTGNYQVQYTYVRKVGSAIAHESNPSPASNTFAAAAQQISITGIVDSSDAQVTHKRIYRTIAGGTSFLFDQEIATGTTTATSSQADSALGSAVETDNNLPPLAEWVVEFQGHLFLGRNVADGHSLQWSKRYRPESWPAVNQLFVSSEDDPIQCLVVIAGMLGIFTKNTKYRLVGNSTTGFNVQEALSKRGTTAHNAVVATEYGVIFPSFDGIFASNLATTDQLISEPIEGIFSGVETHEVPPINWSQASTMAGAVWNNRYYLSYNVESPSGRTAVYNHTERQWTFYDWITPCFFVDDAGALFLGGGINGQVFSLEHGASDVGAGIVLTARTREVGMPDIYTRKLFQWMRIDANAFGGTLTAELYIDGVHRHTESITDNRTRALIHLPAGLMGRTWHLRFLATGTQTIEIFGAVVLFVPLGIAA